MLNAFRKWLHRDCDPKPAPPITFRITANTEPYRADITRVEAALRRYQHSCGCDQ
jgi:hypothetical protein